MVVVLPEGVCAGGGGDFRIVVRFGEMVWLIGVCQHVRRCLSSMGTKTKTNQEPACLVLVNEKKINK